MNFRQTLEPGLITPPNHIENDPRKVYFEAFGSNVPVTEYFGKSVVEHIYTFEYEQDGQPSCVAETGSRILGSLEYDETGALLKHSTGALMSFIKTYIEKNEKRGAYLSSCPKALIKFGCPIEGDFETDYNVSWEDFIDASNISREILQMSTRARISTYAWTAETNIDSYKFAIWNSQAKIVHGGVIGTNQGWKTGEVRPPLPGERTWNHSLAFIGFSSDKIYVANSWGYDWGVTLYLKEKFDRTYGEYYVLGTPAVHSLKIKGIGVLDKRYNNPLPDGRRPLFKGLGYTDLPNTEAFKIDTFKVIKLETGVDQYLVYQENKIKKIPDIETRGLLEEMGLIYGDPVNVTQEEFNQFEYTGLLPSQKLMNALSQVVKDIFLPDSN